MANPPPTSAWLENITFDNLQLGQSASLQRTLHEADIRAFAALSGDLNPAHLDPVYAAQSRFHTIIGHGMWCGALISAVLGTQLPGPGTIYLGQALEFLAPVHVGDTLTVTLTVTNKDNTKPIVTLQCEIKNQADILVVRGTATVLAPITSLKLPRPTPDTLQLNRADRAAALIKASQALPAVRTAVVHPVQPYALQAVAAATAAGLIVPELVGPAARIRAAAASANLDITGWTLHDTEHSHAAAARAAALASAGQVQAIMKGAIQTAELMEALVPTSAGLRTERRFSHIYLLDVPTYHKWLLVSDAAINIAPDLLAKRDITQNAINAWQALFVGSTPKVALLAAVESINPAMPATLDAAALCTMATRGQIVGGVLDGPLAFDNAIDPAAAARKQLHSQVAGDADILICPNIEVANVLAKQLSHLNGAEAAGIVMGARVPIILPSRSDSPASQLLACALAVQLAAARQAGRYK